MKAAKKLLLVGAFLAGVSTLGTGNAYEPPSSIDVLIGKNCKVTVRNKLANPVEVQRVGSDGMIAFCPEIET